MRREEVRRVEMRGEKISTVRHAQQKWEEKMRTDEKELKCGAEMKRTVSEMKTADRRREQLRWTEKRWENMRWGHMKFVFNCTCIDAAVKASYVTSWRGSVGWNHGDGVNRWTNSMLWWRCDLLQFATPEPFSRNVRHAPDATWQKCSCNFQPVFPVTVKMLPTTFQLVLHANLLVFTTNFLMLGSQIFQLNSNTFFDVMLWIFCFWCWALSFFEQTAQRC